MILSIFNTLAPSGLDGESLSGGLSGPWDPSGSRHDPMCRTALKPLTCDDVAAPFVPDPEVSPAFPRRDFRTAGLAP